MNNLNTVNKMKADRERLIEALNMIADLTSCDGTYEYANQVLIGKETTELESQWEAMLNE